MFRVGLILLFVAILWPVAGIAGAPGVKVASPHVQPVTTPETPQTADFRTVENQVAEMEREFGSVPLETPPTGPEKVATALTLGWDGFKGLVKLPFRVLGWGFSATKNTVSVAGGTVQAGGEMAHEKTDKAQIWVDQGFK